MTPAELIAAFETLAEAPDGVVQLRELVLQLAVRGLLVEQSAADRSADVLVERIMASARGRKIRVEVHHEAEKPFPVPRSWGWVYLGDAMELFNGCAFKPSDWKPSGMRIVRIQNLNDATAAYNYCDPSVAERFCIDSGCLLLSWSGTPGTSFGAFVWQGGRAALNQHIFRCEPRGDAFATHYLRLAINSRLNEMIARAHGGVGLRHITKGKLEGLWLPVPPLAEQRRIVARVEELMGLLDRLEAARTKREATRAAARDSVLAALREADSPEAVDSAWTRFAQRMDDLLCDPADIAPLRQAVLQLAVRGRLVRQDPKDESARQSLRAAQKAAGLHPQESTEPPGADGFPTPSGWTWVAVGAAGRLRLGKMLDKAKNKGIPCPYLRNTNVHWFRFELDSIKEMPIKSDEIDELLVSPGDLLICEGGHGIARSAVWRGELPRVVFQKALHRVRPLPCLNSDWLSYCLRVLESIGDLQRHYTGAGIPHFTGKALARVVVPLPPLAEQQHIVARVKELMGLLDRLEQRFAAVKHTHAAFAGAAVHHVVA